MDMPWFDQESGLVQLDKYVEDRPTFRKAVEDEDVTDQELIEQAERVTALLRRLEARLDPETKALATEALCELAVQAALYRYQLARDLNAELG
jgi:hypothetical protein